MFQADESIAGYRIVSKLGAGGMGEVWRAEDLKLGREVALKVLPPDVASDQDRLLRFEREAKVLASLNHPNIATLFGLESATPEKPDSAGPEDPQNQVSRDNVTCLVMELVDGEDLSERIARGSIPVEEATRIALQIAEALEAAHEQGIVHRDLKPANIKIRPDGTVKVLDFGLAKAWESKNVDHSLSLSPTLTHHATAAGIILGTAGYMAPEQAAGTAADRRADIWSFGVVLWEMLTGVKLFEGETVSHVLASVLKDEPDLDVLPDGTPPKIIDLVERCLRKEPKLRIQAMGDVRIVLDEYLGDPDAAESFGLAPGAEPTAAPIWKRSLPWAAAAVLGLALIAAVLLRPSGPEPVIKATIPPPEGMQFDLRPASPGPAVVSPDGTKIAFTALDDNGTTRVFIRRLDAGNAHALSGTEGAQYPFWAPDSRWLGFFTQPDDLLRKIDSNGGPPITLCPASNGKGGAWSPEGDVIFAENSSSGLSRVSAAGGEPTELTVLDMDIFNSHRFPWFLPDGRQFFFMARAVAGEDSAIMIGSLDGDQPIKLMVNDSQAVFASGQLIFVRDQTLMAQAFDPESLTTTSDALPVAEGVLTIPGASLSVFGASTTGVLTYQTGSAISETTLEWRDRTGRPLETLGDPAHYRLARLSPDGARAVTQIVDMESGTQDLWIYEIARNLRTRFTFNPLADVTPVWSADGEAVFFASNRDGAFSIYRKPLSGVGEAELVATFENNAFPDSVSPDGRYLVALTAGDETGGDLHLIDLSSGGEMSVFRATEFNEGGGVVSPDGRWIAYHSDESGEFETFVTTFPQPGRKWQVSTASGVYPEWTRNGREIVYSDFSGKLIAVDVDPRSETFTVGAASPLFSVESPDQGGSTFSAAADAERFLVVPGVTQQADTLLNLVVNWPVQLEARR